MKIVYLNDERRNITLRILDANYDPNASDHSHTYHILRPCELRVFEVAMPPGAVPYIKKWPDMVMLSYIDQSALAQLEQRPIDPVEPPGDSF